MYDINYKGTLDGRSLRIDLVNADEGEDAKQLSISMACNTIATTFLPMQI